MDVNFDRGQSLGQIHLASSFEDCTQLLPLASLNKIKGRILGETNEVACRIIEDVFRNELDPQAADTKVIYEGQPKTVAQVLSQFFLKSADLMCNPYNVGAFQLAGNYLRYRHKASGDYTTPTRFLAREYLISDYADEIFNCSDKVTAVGVYGGFVAGKKQVDGLKVCVLCKSTTKEEDSKAKTAIQTTTQNFEDHSQFFQNIKFDLEQNYEYHAAPQQKIDLKIALDGVEAFKEIKMPILWIVYCAKISERIAFYTVG